MAPCNTARTAAYAIRLTFVAVAVFLMACRQNPTPQLEGPHLVQVARAAMGTELRLSAWTGDERGATRAFEEVFAEVERLEALMSVWREGSDIVRLNEAAGRHPVVIAPDVMDALGMAREVGDLTGGAFDVTFGALSDIWKFDHDQDNRVPSPAEVRARLGLVDYRALELDAGRGTAYLARPGMRAHLGGIGKGYAVDRASAMLRSHGLADFMIQFGGDSYVAGRHGDRLWRFGIADPRATDARSFAALDLSDAALSTSGDYERFFIRDGRRYHHIIDPRRGFPAEGTRSVTIVAARSVLADGLSTGVFVLGPEEGMALIERLPGVEAVIVSGTNRVLVSSGLQDRLEVLAVPTKE